MKITELDIEVIPVQIVDHHSTPLTEQAKLARNLFKTLGITGLVVRSYKRAMTSGVEVFLPAGSSVEEADKIRRLLAHVFPPDPKLNVALIFRWFVEIARQN